MAGGWDRRNNWVGRPETTAGAEDVARSLSAEYGFLEGEIAPEALARACGEGADRGIAPHLLLINSGALTATRYLELLDGFVNMTQHRAGGGVTEIVDALWAAPSGVVQQMAAVRARGNVPLLLMPHQIDWSEPPETRRWRADAAANGLLRRSPGMSAGNRFANWQIAALPVLPGLAIGGLLVATQTTLALLASIVTLPFLMIVCLRLVSLAVAIGLPTRRPAQLPNDAELPVYSVLVPLFREAEVVGDLVEALSRLDYPAAKLDILLILESVDHETQAALRQIALPVHFRVLVVPDLAPRTKPKALHYALRVARGDFVVIYDAEDEPEPDQLRRAVLAFRSGPVDLMCVQGRLATYRDNPGWIARQFTLEYAGLFDAMLPALVRLGLPVPLGGTSNHFPRAALEALGGWDAYNVTEDADLGMRIARMGGRVEILQSTTYEEAPDELRIWIPQRTRWIKGFMQTWLVHMRQPSQLWRDLGPVGFLGFNAFLGGIVLSALIHPIFVVMMVVAAVTGQLMIVPETTIETLLLGLALFNLVGGYFSGMAIAGVAVKRRRLFGLLPHLALMPIYWLLISLAAYRAALQLVTNPYLWEKTPHRARKGKPGRTSARG